MEKIVMYKNKLVRTAMWTPCSWEEWGGGLVGHWRPFHGHWGTVWCWGWTMILLSKRTLIFPTIRAWWNSHMWHVEMGERGWTGVGRLGAEEGSDGGWTIFILVRDSYKTHWGKYHFNNDFNNYNCAFIIFKCIENSLKKQYTIIWLI